MMFGLSCFPVVGYSIFEKVDSHRETQGLVYVYIRFNVIFVCSKDAVLGCDVPRGGAGALDIWRISR
jgi:hypothetical protein